MISTDTDTALSGSGSAAASVFACFCRNDWPRRYRKQTGSSGLARCFPLIALFKEMMRERKRERHEGRGGVGRDSGGVSVPEDRS